VPTEWKANRDEDKQTALGGVCEVRVLSKDWRMNAKDTDEWRLV